MRDDYLARIARRIPSWHAQKLTVWSRLHAMQALFQLSYSPTIHAQ
jgi:hypothetical protein